MRQRLFTSNLALWLSIAVVFSLVSCGNDDDSPQSSGTDTTETSREVATVSVGMTDTGTGGILWTYILEEELDDKYDLDVQLTHQTAIDALYQDFSGGRYDIVQAVPSAVLPMAAAGVPVEILFPYSPANFSMLARTPLDLQTELEGLRITGATNSGSYRLAGALLKEFYDFDLLDNTVPGSNNLEAIAQVQANTADAAIIWEPDATLALSQYPDLQIVWDPREDFKEHYGGELWGSVFAYRTDAGYSSEGLARFRDMVAEACESLQADPERADALAQQIIESEPGVVGEAFSSGRLVLEVPDEESEAMVEIRNALEVQSAFEGNMNIPDEIFGN